MAEQSDGGNCCGFVVLLAMLLAVIVLCKLCWYAAFVWTPGGGP